MLHLFLRVQILVHSAFSNLGPLTPPKPIYTLDPNRSPTREIFLKSPISLDLSRRGLSAKAMVCT